MKEEEVIRKVVSMLLTGALVLGTPTGCAGKEKAAENEVRTLDAMWFSDAKEGESFMKLTNQHMKEYPNIKIELVEVSYSDLDSKLRNMLNGKKAPALTRITNLGPFQSQLLDLGEYVSNKEALIDSFGEGLRFVYDGKVVAAPMDVGANGLVCNKTAFDKAEVPVPQSEDEIWTWDEWKDAMKTVMEKGDCRYGLVYDYTPQRLTILLYQAGGSLLNEDLTASNFNTDASRRTLSSFEGLHDEEIIPSSVWPGSENPNNLFRSGQVAMHIGGTWLISNYKDEIMDLEWGVIYLPKEVARSAVSGGKQLAAFQNTGVEKEAAEFIERISKAEQNAQYCLDSSFPSQVKGNENLDYKYGKEFFNIFSQELVTTGSQPDAEWGYQAFTDAVQAELKKGIVDVLVDKITVDESVEKMDSRINEALKELEQSG